MRTGSSAGRSARRVAVPVVALAALSRVTAGMAPTAQPATAAVRATATPPVPRKLPLPSGQAAPSRHAADHVLVRFRSGTTVSVRSARVRAAGGTALRAVPAATYDRVVTGDVVGSLRALRKDPSVAWAGYDYIRQASAVVVPNDPFYTAYGQYLSLPRVQSAWTISKGSTAQVIAVVDSGVDATAPDLAGRVLPGYDFVDGDSNAAPAPADAGCPDPAATGHGTFVASVAAAGTDNGVGVAGVAWTARVLPVRVLDQCGDGLDSNVAAGIEWAADHHATIINLSLGGTDPDPLLQQALQYAAGKNIPVVVAAGNAGSDVKQYPAAYPEAISVAATDRSGNLTSFSSFGDWVDVAAPGWDIVGEEPRALCSDVSHPTDCYFIGAGTSFSAPIVSGVVALVKARYPTWTADQVRARLEATARPGGGLSGRTPFYGYGVVDAYAALGAQQLGTRTSSSDVQGRSPAQALPLSAGTTALSFAHEGEPVWTSITEAGGELVTIDATPKPLTGGVDRASIPQQLALTVQAYDSGRHLIGTAGPAADGTATGLLIVLPAGTDLVEFSNGNGSLPVSQQFLVTVTAHNPAAPQTPGPTTWIEDQSAFPGAAVAVDAAPTFQFDRDLDPSTLTAQAVVLRSRSGAVVPTTPTYAAGTRTLTVTPDAPLLPDSVYELTLNGGSPAQPVTDGTGEMLPFVWTSLVTGGTPPPLAGLTVRASKAVSLSWQMPDYVDFGNVAVYSTPGTVPLPGPGGRLEYYGSLSSVTLTDVVLGHDYSYTLVSYSNDLAISPAVTAVVRGTTTSLFLTNASPVYGTSVRVYATVKGADGQPIAGRPVTMYSRRTGHTTWGTIGTATTDAFGQVSVTVTPTANTEFDAVSPGDSTHLVSTALLSVP
ncbi:MAG: S8 family serine peptidase, partial [Actinomycetes bacterium]